MENRTAESGVTNAMLKKRSIIASLLVGVLGALLGIVEGLAGTLEGIDNGLGGYYAHFTLPAGVISGFFLCFILSMVYLRFMTHRWWGSIIGWGILFGTFAGTLSGIMMGIALIFAGVHDLWWAIPGAVVGAGFGLIMGLLGHLFLNKLTG